MRQHHELSSHYHWVACLAHCMTRYEATQNTAAQNPSGGGGVFSAGNFPEFDYMRSNVYVIADSNQFMMIGVG